jgi:mannobiose 2-epimerase
MSLSKPEILKAEVTEELVTNILPFWMTKMIDDSDGGFLWEDRWFGSHVFNDADKGCVLNARILWTFLIGLQGSEES